MHVQVGKQRGREYQVFMRELQKDTDVTLFLPYCWMMVQSLKIIRKKLQLFILASKTEWGSARNLSLILILRI